MTVEHRIRELHPDCEQNGILGLFSNNPMLRYRTENGPITSPMGLLSLSTSTMSQVHSAYLPTKLNREDNTRKSSNYLTREKKEREIKKLREEAEREEE